jgi:hypothetical protein
MDLNKIKEIITSFLLNIYILFKHNTNIVILIFIILIVIVVTYLFSKQRRILSKLNYINNNLTYDKPRLTIDYCGINNNNKDKLLVKINPLHNGITILPQNNKKIDLWKYNLSSEFVVEIKGKYNHKYDNMVNEPYKIKNIDPIDSNKLYFTNDTIFPANGANGANDANDANLVEILFYRPNPNKNENPYKHKKICEYTFSSSYNSFLIGNQILDYCSLDMIQQVLYFGARYIEIPIYDLEQKDDTTPILHNTINGFRMTLNYIEVEKVLELLGKMAFNYRLLDNYNDPLFLYLDIKTKNIKTLDKVHDYIIKYLNKYLLPSSYNHINIAYTKLCDVENKCVILSSNGYQNSKLDQIINCSTNKDYLKRITYNESLLNKDELQGAKFKLNSNKVKFFSSNINDAHTPKSLFKDYIEIVDDNINLFNYGITKGDGLNISGSKNAKNNSGEYIYLIDSITRNKIIFEKSVELTNEEIGKYISLNVYDKDGKGEKLEEYNKNNLTIVIPDSKLSSANYEYKNAMYKGCQFVCMNFQNIDDYMKNYFNLFKQKAILFKPKVLINSINIPKSVSINSMVPTQNKDIVLNYDYNLIDSIRSERYSNITPFNNNKLRLIGYGQTLNDTNLRHIKFSMNYNNSNSRLKIIKGLNNKPGYISIKLDERYLTYRDCCCYLYLTKSPNNDIDNSIKYKFNNSASFLALVPPITKKGYNSLGVIKSINDKDKLYYLKIRSDFNSNRKLFVKKVTEYESKMYLTQTGTGTGTGTKLVVLKPKFNSNGNFFPTGDIVIREDRLLTLNYDESTVATATSTATATANEYQRELDDKQNPKIICKENHTKIDNVCYKPCEAGYIKDTTNENNCLYEYDNKTVKPKEESDPGEFKYECPYGYELNDDKCYKVCDEGYIRKGLICEEDITLEKKETLATQPVIKSEQNFETEIFSGAVDHPKDYELIWSNSDLTESYQGQEISIWKPIANEGFMEMGNVFVNGYIKPQTNEVVCISVDYLKEESIYSDDINYEFGKPIFYNVESQLALWNISQHDYVKAYPFVKLEDVENNNGSVVIPNIIEFKMYDFITEEKDYYDRLYLDTDISSKSEKEATLLKISFDSIIESSGNDVYDYLMKLENSNGKLISYTPSETGSKMCMALPQPYWSSFYDSVSNDNQQKILDPVVTCKDDHTKVENKCYKPCSELKFKSIDNILFHNYTFKDDDTKEDLPSTKCERHQCYDGDKTEIINDKCKYGYTKETIDKCVNSNGETIERINEICYGIEQSETYCVNTNYIKNNIQSEKHEYDTQCPYGYELNNTTQKCNSKQNINTTTKIKFEPCKSRDYFGTNWNIYNDNTIRLEGNKDACLTYNGNPKSNISLDIDDSNNYLYLDKCNPESNQEFEFVNDNIKVLTNTEYDPNACITHSPEDGLRLEECGDKKFTVVSKWMDKIATVDKCTRIDAEKEMEKIGAIELCDNLSYYVVYLSGGVEHRHEEYCSYEDAKAVYEKVKNDYKRGIAIIHAGTILLKKRLSSNEDNILKNYATKLLNIVGDCVKCKRPSKILCVENSIVDSEHTHFENDKEKKSISEHCRKLKNEINFKCSRGYRQKFTNNINPNDFCINYNKEVFVYIYSKDQYPQLDLDVSRVSQTDSIDNNAKMLPVDNLLGENYDTNYHMFLKGICTTSPNSNKFRIVFDNDKIQGLNLNYIDLNKFSNDIILNYIPKYDTLKIGTKVLAKLTTQDNEALLNKKNITYDNIGFKTNNITIKSTELRWMGVVIEKLKNNQVEIMFSINSYESDPRNNSIANNKNRPFSLSNIRKIYNVNDLVLLKKAPLCL